MLRCFVCTLYRYICNPSYHNLFLLTLSITCFNYIINARNTCTRDSKRTCNWKKASYENIAEYKSHLDEKLISIKLSNDTYSCVDVHCKSIQHCQDIDYLCSSIINYCLESSVLAIPFVRSGNGDIPGWTEQVNPELDNAKFWHWILKVGRSLLQNNQQKIIITKIIKHTYTQNKIYNQQK